MTPTSAPSGLKLTEEHKYVLRKRGMFYRPDACGYTSSISEAGRYTETEAQKHVGDGVTSHLASDWRDPLADARAECDAKDAEIARLKEQKNDLKRLLDAARAECTDLYEVVEEQTERANRAEARLAAMATVTEEDAAQGAGSLQSAYHGAFGKSLGAEIGSLRIAMRAALEAFVANKTAGGT